MAHRIFISTLLLILFVALSGGVDAENRNSVAIVEGFWRDVWQAQDPEAVDNYVTEDFIITSGGKDIRTREAFKKWIADFQSKITDMKFEVIETFQDPDGSRVASRVRVTGKNNGMFGLKPDQAPFVLTATAIWAVNPDGRLEHNWVERNAWEVYSGLARK